MAVGKETGVGVTLQQLRQELKPITERLDGIDKRLDKLESGQEKLRDDLIGAFNEALARAAPGQLTNIRQFRKEAAGG